MKIKDRFWDKRGEMNLGTVLGHCCFIEIIMTVMIPIRYALDSLRAIWNFGEQEKPVLGNLCTCF